MKKIVAVLAAVFALSTATAQAAITKQRIEEIFSIAKSECPAIYQAKDAQEYMRSLQDSMFLDNEEVILLLNFCLMYGQGLTRSR